jgi:hypothetical protein
VFEAQQSHIRTETGTGSGPYDYQQKASLHPMITFFATWFSLAFIALVFNYAIHHNNPED